MPSSPPPADRARGGDAELVARARAWGVEPSWEDAKSAHHQVPAATLEAILGVLGGLERPEPPGDAEGPLVVRTGAPLTAAGVVRTEDGDEVRVEPGRRARLPIGHHHLALDGGGTRPLIVSPGRCHLPAGLRTWGWAAQLYSLRSARSWGLGDYGDLAELAAWSAGLDAGVLLLNPLHYSTPVAPVPASPYSPGSRRFREPLYLCVEDLPGAAEALGADLGRLQRAAAALREAPLLDRDAVFALKMPALRRVWEHTAQAGAAELDSWRATQGADLDAFGLWCALAEEHGADWRRWPASLHRRDSPAVAAEARRLARQARFHVWLQWQVDRQLRAAGREVALIHDLAIGVDPGGADAWLWPSAVAQGVHVGAPPDLFNTRGQDWGIAPFDAWALRAAAYRPFADTLRACVAGAGGLRIDHVMGLSRLFWIPPGASPRDGAYVRYPAADLFDVLALESVRASAFVVGEDLGTVEASVRRQLRARDVLSYRLLWFEERSPRRWPKRALGAVSTHDLPTVAGVWTGADIRAQVEAGTEPDVARNRALRAKLARLADLPARASVEDAVLGAHRALAGAPSALLLATLEDALAVEARPNLPGTVAPQWPSWSMPLPLPLEAIRELPLPRRIASLLAAR
ncbi:MAG TPA: 4-alpha-glucanotransferase [Candidatus Angelobacter sp.]|jgi:4-alpha-glucanotransferase|nr:4-alpha-glucanotransferase [Candidatus Angelobacter sp.]